MGSVSCGYSVHSLLPFGLIGKFFVNFYFAIENRGDEESEL